MKLTEKQQEIMAACGHLLVTGGPGSGKTTIAILKAALIVENHLGPGQKVLFLSFARATVSRVIEAIEYEHKLPREQKKSINVETYHSFFWRILKTHGYLVGLPRKISILPPPNEAIALSAIRSGYASESKLTDFEKAEKRQRQRDELLRLSCDEGSICFDLFALYSGKILHGSERIRKLVAAMYPVIIFDEFQDTNADQWNVVRALGQFSQMVAIADPEQRIYDWIGADPERLNHFKERFAPLEIDLSTDNHRSAGTEIVTFANDVLKGKFSQGSYNGIKRLAYPPTADQGMAALVRSTLSAIRRLTKNGKKHWSLAVLVPTKKMTRIVSDHFRNPPAGLPQIYHTAAINMEAAILAAEVIGFLMQPDADDFHFRQFISLLQDYFHGKGGDEPTQRDLKEASNIGKAYTDFLERSASASKIRGKSILIAIIDVYNQARTASFTGNPDTDWKIIRKILDKGACPRLKGLAQDVRNMRLLERGVQLRQALSQDWRDNGFYKNALAITKQAFVQEHFSTDHKPEKGVVVMNMHKAKGKQFDEVIIFEGWPKIVKRKIVANPDRIVWSNSRDNDNDQARQNFRVSITRGKAQTTILTPKNDPCILLFNEG